MSKVDATPENVAEEVQEVVEASAAATDAGEEEQPKKRRGRKPGSGKKTAAAEVKEPAKKKAGRPAKKEEESAAGTEVIIQIFGNDINIAKLEENIKAQFVAEGHRAGNIKNLQVYVKPEENKAYYVINDGKYTGDIGLF